ncbi:hypothetical protein MAPG_03568 [Magnaporthiopsis poae ATCC 64411]|uniref:Uncharacterized protein n=1 Tax=Magnaporthiopsis poae (strain ATCC 64411 / 73-15) TaxID=644358 RepID=A0A0C4DUC8_MAGP6|nr:hypothetical protein MAPG_03568 [Magnaporthiopsis poae ATCC 64411]
MRATSIIGQVLVAFLATQAAAAPLKVPAETETQAVEKRGCFGCASDPYEELAKQERKLQQTQMKQSQLNTQTMKKQAAEDRKMTRIRAKEAAFQANDAKKKYCEDKKRAALNLKISVAQRKLAQQELCENMSQAELENKMARQQRLQDAQQLKMGIIPGQQGESSE